MAKAKVKYTLSGKKKFKLTLNEREIAYIYELLGHCIYGDPDKEGDAIYDAIDGIENEIHEEYDDQYNFRNRITGRIDILPLDDSL